MVDRYDAGLLNDFGGGNVEWWQDYLRAELERAHDFYADQIEAAERLAGARVVTDGMVKAFQDKYREFWKGSWPDTETSRKLLEDTLAEPAGEAEPVAFIYEWKPKGVDNPWQVGISFQDPHERQTREYRNIRPLYTTPPASAIRETVTMPELPDDDSDFTPDLARAIIAKYQEYIRHHTPPASAIRGALRPFAEVADKWVDDEGWTEFACNNDRICDWFGPSDFRAAIRALAGSAEVTPKGNK